MLTVTFYIMTGHEGSVTIITRCLLVTRAAVTEGVMSHEEDCQCNVAPNPCFL